MNGGDVRETFDVAVAWFLDVLAHVDDGQWDAPGLGEWTVRQLAAHTARALLTVEQYLDEPGVPIELDSAASYYAAVLALPGIHESVAERGREAAADYGDDLLAEIRGDADRVTLAVAGADAEAVCRTRGGIMRLDDYLATRVVELIVHTIDLALATGQDPTPPRVAADLCTAVLVSSVRADDVPTVVMALTGRRPLPDGYSVLAATGG